MSERKEQLPSNSEKEPIIFTFHAVGASRLVHKHGLEEAIKIVQGIAERTIRSMKFEK